MGLLVKLAAIPWGRLISLFVAVGEFLLEKTKIERRRKGEQDAQKQRDAISRDPVDFLNQHFGGGVSEADTNGSSNDSDSEASEA